MDQPEQNNEEDINLNIPQNQDQNQEQNPQQDQNQEQNNNEDNEQEGGMFDGLQNLLIGNNNQDMAQFVTLQQFLLQIVADNSSNQLTIDHNLLMFQACVYGLNNSIFFNEETIDSLKEYLFSISTPIDELNLNDENIQQQVKMRMQKRRNEVTNMLSKDSFALTQNPVMDDSLKHLDKIINVLRCKKKLILIRRKRQNEQMDNLPTMYDVEQQSVSFYDKGYHLTIKSQATLFDKKEDNYIKKFPGTIWRRDILIYFSAYELFKLRGVNKMFREYVREIWLRIYQREMLEQLITADLCGDVDAQTKMLTIRRPFYHKFGICLKAILELINWDDLKQIMFTENIQPRIQYLFLALYAILGFKITIKSPQDIVGSQLWEDMKDSFENIKDVCDIILTSNFHFTSNKKLIEIRKTFVDIYDISRDLILVLNDRNLLLLQLFIKQLSIFSLLKNSTFLGNYWIEQAKEQMTKYANTWSKKKGFLEGAYKILLFRYIRIQGNKIEADANIIHQLTKEMALTKNLILFLLNVHLFENKNLEILDKLTDQDESKAFFIHGNQKTSLLKISPGKGEEYLVHIDIGVKKELLMTNLTKAKSTLQKQIQELRLLKQLSEELTKLEQQKLKKKALLEKQKKTQELLNENIKKFQELRSEQLALQREIATQTSQEIAVQTSQVEEEQKQQEEIQQEDQEIINKELEEINIKIEKQCESQQMPTEEQQAEEIYQEIFKEKEEVVEEEEHTELQGYDKKRKSI